MTALFGKKHEDRREKKNEEIDDFFRLKDGQQVVDFEKFMNSDIGSKLKEASRNLKTSKSKSDENSEENEDISRS